MIDIKCNNIFKISLYLLLSFFWIISLSGTDAYYSVYILIMAIGMVATYDNIFISHDLLAWGKNGIVLIIYSTLFAIAVALANYHLFLPLSAHIIRLAIFCISSYVIFCNVLMWLYKKSDRFFVCHRRISTSKENLFVFLISFCGILFIDMLYLFLAAYPGILTNDSISQMQQLLSNSNYSNHAPFYHTMLIKGCVSIGLMLFNDINAAVAVYSCLSIVMIAGTFAYVLLTMYQIGAPRGLLIVVWFVYALSPYNIAYSITMWKDIPFAAAVTIFITSLLRIFSNPSTRDYVLLIVGEIGFGLLRSNGWIALAVTCFILFILFRKDNKRLIRDTLFILVVTFIFEHQVIGALGVTQPDTVEKLSIPVQQIARVVKDERKLSGEDEQMIGKVMDISTAADDYTEWLSDPIKNNIRRTGEDYLNAHKSEYFNLWVKLGIKYPGEYTKAWVDQTRGYWNASGYSYWIWAGGGTGEFIWNKEYSKFRMV